MIRASALWPTRLDPAAAVLHYSQAIFDGLKAFAASTARCCPSAEARAADQFGQVDAHPRSMPTLPLRPSSSSGHGAGQGARPSGPRSTSADDHRSGRFSVCGPRSRTSTSSSSRLSARTIRRAGARQSRGGKVRAAVDGGLGGVKAGANYAASLMAGEEAKHAGYAGARLTSARKYIDGSAP